MITIENLLPELKANKHTYTNLNSEYVSDFKKHYNYLKKHKNLEIKDDFVYKLYIATMKRNCNMIDYNKKYQGIVFLITNLRFNN